MLTQCPFQPVPASTPSMNQTIFSPNTGGGRKHEAMTPVFARGRLQYSVCMNFPVRGKPDKEPPLPGCTKSGIISGTNFFFPVPSGLSLQEHLSHPMVSWDSRCLQNCVPPSMLFAMSLAASHTHPTKKLCPNSLLWSCCTPRAWRA